MGAKGVVRPLVVATALLTTACGSSSNSSEFAELAQQRSAEDRAKGSEGESDIALAEALPGESDLVRLGFELEEGSDWMPEGPDAVVAVQNLCTLEEVQWDARVELEARDFSIESNGDWWGSLFVSALDLRNPGDAASFIEMASEDPDGWCTEIGAETQDVVILERESQHVIEVIARHEHVVFKVRHVRNDDLESPRFRAESLELVEDVASIVAESLQSVSMGDSAQTVRAEMESLAATVSEHQRVSVSGFDVNRVVPAGSGVFARLGSVFETESEAAQEAEALSADDLPPIGIFDVRDDERNDSFETSGGAVIDFVGYWIVLGPWDQASEARRACAVMSDLTSLGCEVEAVG